MSCLPPRCSPLLLLRTPLLRSRSTATTTITTTTTATTSIGAAATRTRGICIGSRQGIAAIPLRGANSARVLPISTLLRVGGDGRTAGKRFYSVNDRDDNKRKDGKVEKNGGERDEKKDGDENVIYYQPPPEGYEEPARKHQHSADSSTSSKDEPQLGYIFENVMPPRSDGKAADSTTAYTADGSGNANADGVKSTDEGGYHPPMRPSENGRHTLRDKSEPAWANETVNGSHHDAGSMSTSEIAQANMDADTKAAADASEFPTAPSNAEGAEAASAPSDANDKHKGKANTLPSQIQQRRSEWRKKFENMMDNMQSNVFMAGQTLNDLTGYSGIERLKQEIIQQEEAVRTARRRVRDCKDAYTDAIHRRSASQREVNELLQRKHAWSPTDVERFTSLYRSDHANERGEAMAQEELANAERESEEASTTLSRTILARYHEEQIWSDKIRRMSTWGTWGLMGVNVLLFLVFQIAVEPWRRKRLVTGFEEKVLDALEKEREITVRRENIRDQEDAGPMVAAATAAIEAVKEAAREMRGAVRSVGEQFDANEQVAGEEMIMDDDGAEMVPVATESVDTSKGADEAASAAAAAATAPESSSPPPLALDEEALRTQFHRFIAKILVKLPPLVAQRFIEFFRNDTTVSMSPRDLSAIALESAAAGAALTSVAAGILVMVFRGQ